MNNQPRLNQRPGSIAGAVLLTALVAGTLDITAAITYYCFIVKALGPQKLLMGIAAGALGNSIFWNQPMTALTGLFFHYLIALGFTASYFTLYGFIPFLGKHKIISGLLFGLLVWVLMNLVVLPLSRVHHYPIRLQAALIGAGILVCCIGIPVAWMTKRYYPLRQGLPVH
jgi:hypothetical protein